MYPTNYTSHNRRWLIVLVVAILCSLLPPSLSASVRAQNSNAGFASAVACLNGDLSLATTCFADTIFAPVPASDPALVRVTLSSVKQALAPIGTVNGGHQQRIANNTGIGSVYGLAYDDGAISGIRRLFAAAFTRRFTSFGPLVLAVSTNTVLMRVDGERLLRCLILVQNGQLRIKTMQPFSQRLVLLVSAIWKLVLMEKRFTLCI